jgi:NADH:quinone reductase (non-electrogenic)
MRCRHVGESDITNFILLNRARQSLKVPFIASGGLADGQGLAAALCLGAEGINMGTRFMCTVEAPIHHNIKEAIVKASETDTALVMRRWTNTTRLYKNKVTEEALKVERESKSDKFDEMAPLMSGKRGREVFINGDPDYGVSDIRHNAKVPFANVIHTGLDRWPSHWSYSRHSYLPGTCDAY